ncbi:MAG: hypothetical protein H7296_03845 [Bacteroidia bacterium]|nr:hypothetical protein [Bacteroidia bacterium]
MKVFIIKFRLLYTLILGSAINCFAQNNYFTVNTEQSGTAFSFPVFSSPANNQTALKINRFLQLAELQLLKGSEKQNLFERVTTNGGGSGKKVLMNYIVQANSNKLLSVQIKESSCETECTNETRYYNFNAGNGDLIHLKDLFTAEGYPKFYTALTTKRTAVLDKQLLKLSAADKALMEGVKECYAASTLNDFYIKENILYLDGENCFYNTQKNQLIKRLDNFTLPEFKEYLNDYGKSLFAVSTNNIGDYRSYILPQLFESREISDSMLIFVLTPFYMEEMKGIYAYINKGIGFKMEGRVKGDELYLAEFENPIGETPYLYATYANNQIKGVLADRRKTITKPVNLIRK